MSQKKESKTEIRSFTFEEFCHSVKSFHGYEAIGVIIGGFMVDRAYRCLPEGGLYDILCETTKCLPDSVQILTPCTIGNGWLKVLDWGRFAIVVYDKKTGQGVRVCIDPVALEKWTEIRDWFLKLKTKNQQDKSLLMAQVREAKDQFCKIQRVSVFLEKVERQHRGNNIVVCPSCKETYTQADSSVCQGCHNSLWEESNRTRLDI